MTETQHVTVDICTKDRYMTTLPLTIQSVITQTLTPDELIIVDDSPEPKDLRTIPIYQYLFQLLDEKKIKWQVIYGKKRGQHFSHQIVQEMAKDLIWRLDDDVVAEPNCLEILLSNFVEGVGGVGGPVLMPSAGYKEVDCSINNVSDNQQWYKFNGIKYVEHLYSCFLFKSNIVDYELSLSSAAHREETILSHNIFRKGYKLIIDSKAICWHLRNPEGGIRNNKPNDWEHDEMIFNEIKREWDSILIAFLDNGIGDHIIFKSLLPKLHKKYKTIKIACCYPSLFDEETMSILEGSKLVNPDRFNLYKFMIDHDWKTEMKYAMERMYDNNCTM